MKIYAPRFRSIVTKASASGFSLVELLLVLAVISIMTAFAVPAMNGIKDAQNVTSATSTISNALQRARTYAVAHNTYVWVGFYEEAATAPAPTHVFPYSGVGRVIMGMVASVDGTKIYPDSVTSGLLNPPSVTPSPIIAIDKLIRVENIHVTDLGAPTGTGTPLSSRPKGAYGSGSTELYGVNSDDPSAQAEHSFTLNGYTFYKTVRFGPGGEVSIDDSSAIQRIGEIDLRPTHGTAINLTTSNVAAIQFTGIGGEVQTYRN
jgi:prepilin-type N-terminal cleavage/methylation domain-containing protein